MATSINEIWNQESVNECIAKHWFKKFHCDEFILNDKGHGHHSATDNNKLKHLMEANPSMAVLELAGELDVSTGIISKHLD